MRYGEQDALTARRRVGRRSLRGFGLLLLADGRGLHGLGLLLLALALAGCSAGLPARASQEAQAAAEPVALRLGVGFGSASPLFLPLYVADDQGFFQKEGVQVELAHLGGSLFVQAATGGDIQMGAISTAAAIAGIAHGAPL